MHPPTQLPAARNKPIRVLTADDHPVVREGLAHIIGQHADLDLVGQAEDGAQAIDLFTRLAPDVLTVDLKMPNIDGLSVIQRVRSAYCDARILILSASDRDATVSLGFRSGALGYLPKTASRAEIIDAIRIVAQHRMYATPEISVKAMRAQNQVSLTEREMDVLRLLAAGRTNKDIGRRLNIGTGTVGNHVHRLYEKLNIRSRMEAVTLAREQLL